MGKKEQTLNKVKELFNIYFPDQKKRTLFNKVAEKHFPDEFNELKELKESINSNTLDHFKLSHNCNRLIHISKDLFRKVAIKLI